MPQWGGELRPGDNLYNNSVVALELKSGKVRWHYQLVHHDIWEHDVGTPLVLYDATIGGRPRKVLLAMRTDGVPFFLDRETGKPVLPVEERPVKQDAFLKTSPTQPFTAGADRVGPACVDKSMIPPGFEAGCYFDPIRVDMPNHYMPHMNMRQTPMAYSPATGYLYASVCVNPAWIRRAETPWAFVRPTRLPGQQQHGFMTAIDARTGKTVWNKRVAYAGCEGGGGATATAGGLVFHVEPDGNFQAYYAKTGDVVWQFQTGDVGFGGGAGPGGGPAVTYESGGVQYVALTMNHVVWAFKRGGTLTPRPAIAAAADDARMGRTRRGHGRDSAGNGQHVHDCERGPEGRVGERLRGEPAARADEGRRGGDVDEHVESCAHDRGTRRFMEHRFDQAGRIGVGDDREGRFVRVHRARSTRGRSAS